MKTVMILALLAIIGGSLPNTSCNPNTNVKPKGDTNATINNAWTPRNHRAG